MHSTHLVNDIREAVSDARDAKRRVGCVMTMGALHAGHRALLEAARQDCDFVVATIFVNPTQFAPGEDLDRYPRPLASDLELCSSVGVDQVFLPAVETMYPAGMQTVVSLSEVTKGWEGAHRPTHFDGVATVVLKLLNIVQPDVAYFGQKDFQQCAVIRQMVSDLNLPVRISIVPTVRDDDGLALSSRNAYLSDTEREAALRLSQALEIADLSLQRGESVADVNAAMLWHLRANPLIDVDYAAVADRDTLEPLPKPQSEMVALVAARVGETRLIDNRLINLDSQHTIIATA